MQVARLNNLFYLSINIKSNNTKVFAKSFTPEAEPDNLGSRISRPNSRISDLAVFLVLRGSGTSNSAYPPGRP